MTPVICGQILDYLTTFFIELHESFFGYGKTETKLCLNYNHVKFLILGYLNMGRGRVDRWQCGVKLQGNGGLQIPFIIFFLINIFIKGAINVGGGFGFLDCLTTFFIELHESFFGYGKTETKLCLNYYHVKFRILGYLNMGWGRVDR